MGRWWWRSCSLRCGSDFPHPAPSRNRGSAPAPAPQSPEGLGLGHLRPRTPLLKPRKGWEWGISAQGPRSSNAGGAGLYARRGLNWLWAIVPRGGTGGHNPATGSRPATNPRPTAARWTAGCPR
ncbi:hypothetical protein EEJ42_34140 [Streptomyces botrytidirepellens]|uniref:Uncharacterized protein n=1 Tax=Streptomyces botrytidirepellens TaxID=2486417 RepID=A0A3M8UG97_9ACTN|nr:hypothetical protein EEJ42_34140 [Streptomyces botrytidirepellens]